MDRPNENPRDKWSTPQSIIHAFGPFEIDAAAESHNSVAPVYLDDAFVDNWFNDPDIKEKKIRTWCNPPYSQKRDAADTNLGDWIDRAVRQWHDCGYKHRLVMCLPCDFTVGWFNRLLIAPFLTIYLSRVRIKFKPYGDIKESSPRGQTMFVVFDSDRPRDQDELIPIFRLWDHGYNIKQFKKQETSDVEKT